MLDLTRYADMGAALCPIPGGGKSPAGLIASFAHDWSKDPLIWKDWSERWPGCNWIMVAGPSQKIVVDIDVKKVGREAAWSEWVKWCKTHDLPTYRPHVQTPSSGWHLYFSMGETDLRQPPLVPGVIDIRAGNGFVLIPPSQIEGVPYQWMQ